MTTLRFNEDKLIKGIWSSSLEAFSDERGTTYEWFNSNELPKDFENFQITQLLTATSIKNVIRGIHFSDISNPQLKIVHCIFGKVLDILVDLRRDSKTFGLYSRYLIQAEVPQILLIPSGIGHAYQVISKSARIQYAIQTNFNFSKELVINPLDPYLKLPWQGDNHILSQRDAFGQNFSDFLQEIQTD